VTPQSGVTSPKSNWWERLPAAIYNAMCRPGGLPPRRGKMPLPP